MDPYEKMYHITFNAISDALNELKELNIGRACNLLEKAQSQAEEIYISQGEDQGEDQGGDGEKE